MAGNDLVNSYLEAILDVGPGLDDAKWSTSLLLRERGRFSPTRYFVEEVITRYDETDLRRFWVRAAATAGSGEERNTRLENMCWRIWNLARKKKQLEGEEAQRTASRRLERERRLRICRRTYPKERVETRLVTIRLMAVIVLEQKECVG